MCCDDSSNFDPSGGGGGGFYALPEQWAYNDVPANLAAATMSAQVSTNFDTIQMIRAGSLVGLSVRFTEAIPVGAGAEATIIVTINGAATALQIVCDGATNSSGGVVTATTGDIPYVAGDLIGMTITTSATFTPTTTDCEAWVQVQEDA